MLAFAGIIKAEFSLTPLHLFVHTQAGGQRDTGDDVFGGVEVFGRVADSFWWQIRKARGKILNGGWVV
jgi:hypothetical protein